jgi:Amt family ammonium transporter
VGFRVSHEAETAGVDLSEHAETAYAFGELGAAFNPLRHAVSHTPVAGQPARQEQAKEESFA